MINRRVTRTILNTTETTALTSLNSAGLSFVLLTTDSFYIGFHGKFSARYFQMSVVNSATSVMSVDYWNGSEWASVDDLVDQTSVGGKTFAQSGFVSWSNKSDWTKRSLTGIDDDIQLYFVRVKVSVDLSLLTKIASVLNLFSDDALLRSYYPEIISNVAYLPSGKTNFLDQHLAAKDLVVLRLKQRRMIDDESQVIDINMVAVAAVHACAWIILSPIATSDDSKEIRDTAFKALGEELSQLTLGVDSNKDGVVSEVERSVSTSTMVVRR